MQELGGNKVDCSDVIKHILVSLVDVASSKTSTAYARTTLKILLRKLERDYDILRYIMIEDEIENNMDAISVMTDVDSIDSQNVGRTIQDIIDLYKKELGEKAGYFFIREFRYVLGDEYLSIIKHMGVDLRLSELKDELYGWEIDKYKIKDHKDANIAYLEKK